MLYAICSEIHLFWSLRIHKGQPTLRACGLFVAGRALRFFRLIKLLSLVRLLRLSRLVRYFNQWQEVCIAFRLRSHCKLGFSMRSNYIHF